MHFVERARLPRVRTRCYSGRLLESPNLSFEKSAVEKGLENWVSVASVVIIDETYEFLSGWEVLAQMLLQFRLARWIPHLLYLMLSEQLNSSHAD